MKVLAVLFACSLLLSATFAAAGGNDDDKGAKHEKGGALVSGAKDAAGAGAAAVAAGAHAAAGGHHWGYEKEGDDWKKDNPLCDAANPDAKQQSPINLKKFSNEEAGNGKPLQLFYKLAKDRKFKNNGHTWQADGDFGYVMLNGKKYNTVQFHFHWKSEHTVEDTFQDAEVHMVHQWDGVPEAERLPNGFNDLLVTGFFIKQGTADHPFFASMDLKNGPKDKDSSSAAAFNVDASKLFTKDLKYYTYPGSLTTPACHPTVTWHVFSEVLPISAASLGAFKKVFSGAEFPKGNRRAVQKRLATTKVQTNTAVLGTAGAPSTPSSTTPSSPSPTKAPSSKSEKSGSGALNPL